MKEFMKYAMLAISIISLVVGLVCTIFILYCEFLGYNKGNDLLKSMNFPLDDNGIIVICFVCGVLLIISILLRKKYFS